MTELDFSIVIPVCHGGRFLRDVLKSIMCLEFPADHFEALIAVGADDTDSCDAVDKAAAEAPFRIRLVRAEGSNRAYRLNRACAVAAGRVLAFTDDDCVLHPGWLGRIAAVMEGRDEVGAVGGGEDSLAAGSFDRALDWVLRSFVGSGGCRFGEGLRVGRFYPKLWNMAVPRETATAAALPGRNGAKAIFDESLAVHEDVELMERIVGLGKTMVWAPDIRVSHSRDTTFGSFLSRNFNMARTCRRKGVHRAAHRLLAGTVLGAGLLAAGAVWWHPPRQVLTGGAGLYAVLLFFSSAASAVAKRSPAAGAWVPAMLVGVHVARGLGYLFPAGRSDRGS